MQAREDKDTHSSTNKVILLWLFVILPIAAAVVFRKSFNLGLYGDDWQHLYILWREFYVYHTKSFLDISSYLNPYFPEYLYLGIINHFWGYYPPAYFIASYLCRLFANIALYFFAYELTKSKLAAFLTTLIFLVSVAGLQTTDWVFNMNTYAGLGLLTIASVIYLRIRKLNTFKSYYYLFFIITFTLGMAVVPTRTHGVVPFIVLTELFLTYVVERKKVKFDKYLITRVLLSAGLFFLLVYLKSYGTESYTNGRFNDSYKLIQALMQNGYYSWWLYFIATIGHFVLPDNVNIFSQAISLQKFLPIKNTLTAALLIEAFLSMILLSISSHSLFKSKKAIYYLPIIFFNALWFLFLYFMNKIDSHTANDIYFSISLGGQFIFWAFWFYVISRNKYSYIASTLIITLFWITSLTILYWLFTPYYIIETTGRYMTMGAAGISIFLGAFCALLFKNSTSKTSNHDENSRLLSSFHLGIPFLILLVFLTTNLQTGQNYLNIMSQTRNKDLTEKTWNTLLKDVPKLDPTAPSVFYFTTDNPLSLEGVLVFGFFMRAGIEWKNPVEALTPLPVTDYQQLLDMVKTGEPLQKVHGRKKAPVPLSRVFAFDFRGGELFDMSKEIRDKIKTDLNLTQ